MNTSRKQLLLTTLRNVLMVLAVITVMPRPASDPDLLGFHTVCAFVPVSTLFLLALAGIVQMLRNSLVDEIKVQAPEPTNRRETRG